MTGTTMLRNAAQIVAERRKAYGTPARSMDLLAKRWSLTLGRPVTPAQVAMCLIVRIPTKTATDSDRKRPRLPIEGGHWFR